jgi:hypothetical protein
MANDRHGIAHAEEIDDAMGYDTFRRPMRVAKSKKMAALELTPRLS